jgi:hypothetical protein
MHSSFATATEWLVIPHQQVGKIKAGWSLEEFKENMDASSYAFQLVPGPEGTEHKAIVVYPNTVNEIQVSYNERNSLLTHVQIKGLGSNWHTINAIKIGSTAKDVKAINKVSFSILGFDWDYAGQISNTNKGSYTGPFLWFEYTGKMSPKYIGDKEIDVSEFLDLDQLIIRQMDVGLNRKP